MGNKGTCKAENCEKDVQAKGYCPGHYAKWRKGKMPKPRYKICNAEGCRKPQERRSLCLDHYGKEYGKKAEATPEAPAA